MKSLTEEDVEPLPEPPKLSPEVASRLLSLTLGRFSFGKHFRT